LSEYWLTLISRLYFRIEFRGVENIPTAGPFLMTPNHVSYFDPIWVSVPVARPLRYMTLGCYDTQAADRSA
jgi:1-acyl-sn-glycerol-3-phosphate acyltransferase